MSRVATSKSLVLVVGAGASKEVGLPTGAELKKRIAEVLNLRREVFQQISGDSCIAEALHLYTRLADSRRPKQDMNSLLKAAKSIRDAMPQAISIDNFIDSHRTETNIAFCGKLAIARCILTAEQESKLFVPPPNICNKLDFSLVEAAWFNSFFQLLTENCEQEELPARLSKVAIICFNYDRCIEHYLYEGLQNYYGMQPHAASEMLAHLAIYHPYGTVGQLPWMNQPGIKFGHSPEAAQLVELVKTLRTFTEGVDPAESDISSIRSALSTAERIAFLGFAFHKLNLQLLFSEEASSRVERICPIYATASGVSSSNIEKITEELSRFAHIRPDKIQLRGDLKCTDLFREYSRSLSIE
jgi:hypothetical protein